MGLEVVTRTLKSKNPDIFLNLGGSRRIPGLTQNCIDAVALCREYSFMPGKLQYLLCALLLLCNISAEWCD
ncbi:TPA: RepA leader peptide Tap [Serratia marcescens]|nr:RepA leader peptide Tap [Serratia marcescens]HED1412916.1 RepA leader peptide Tap [Klebsiella pneumoniae]HED3029638.1 RepA leader peptide Tap [Serratia marcescens]HED3713503.1 RepA leader peptide Tap [Serratia marcescens]HED3729699.1 RepA leader peptide Tap [Serratia marcescens]